MAHPRRHRPARGFTLVELLVALAVLALMAGLGWRSLDGMLRTQQQVAQRADAVLALQAGLMQWQADLDALVETGATSAIDFDGRVLRITRRDAVEAGGGLRVVAWTRREHALLANADLPANELAGRPAWLRWQSPPLVTRADLDQALLAARQWARNPGDVERRAEVAVAALDDWQVLFYRGEAWTNPQSADGTPGARLDGVTAATSPAQIATPPDGVRVVLRLSTGQPVSGTLVRDWVRPTQSGGRS